jgi:opacity protein-like surface antigen
MQSTRFSPRRLVAAVAVAAALAAGGSAAVSAVADAHDLAGRTWNKTVDEDKGGKSGKHGDVLAGRTWNRNLR